MIDAVVFDFSGTLFRLEPNERWDGLFRDEHGRELDADTQSTIMTRMTAPVGTDVPMDEATAEAWERRDLDPALHRVAYLHILQQSGVTDPDLREAIYSLATDPDGWTPYPDTGAVLQQVHDAGVRVAVLSNIAFDARRAFASRGWDRWVDVFVLSFEVGAVKPDERIFEIAAERLGTAPTRALMVGDSAEADGAARHLGYEFVLVEPVPTRERPRGLLDAVAPYLPTRAPD
ncbi:HAD-IA family hydrolase [Rhodococcus triatomae]|uniref:Uncharacterized protein n=1 Tax=Rhodococcus triatomae TaxID=300028 RepID=A0A1G8QM47_9NOCA|nr:HAD-IA family hydrolase [Rhodococcus triatomae]QNG20638.1 HAD-IA family hydrolase [Rhodococcus triatomae]QNG23444.1 HAD-IA family hydrolase [Rhodococcus triatomae]SDJ05445.1 Haloacid dehalogenase superfamily, subfamily IA, variant 2 with 3rd motif like haloacid dehalogenase/haloacid dehalogenase superfamily, subfamily IA, variant 3 with third motif having DD or ED/haloacid dehalogenase superfamily, subfamily IA, variant 1 with third motif having Dx(3-4)D or Dx(3-4)E [Rhodococcus triatomae]